MLKTDGDTFKATPSGSRYALMAPFLILILIYPVFMFLVLCSTLGKSFYSHDYTQVGPQLAGVGGAVTIFSFITVFLANVCVISITLTPDTFRFRNGNRAVSVPLIEVQKICYLQSLKGWMYIIVYTSRGVFTLPNMLYFDRQFNAIKDGMEGWLSRRHIGDLIYKDKVRVGEIGLFGTKQLPFSIFHGITKHIAVLTVFAAVATLVMGLLKVDLLGLVHSHRR